MSRIRLPFAAVLLLGTGCFSASVMQRANTLGKGHFQFAAEPGINGDTISPGDPISPSGSVAARFGVTENVDLGFRVGTGGVELLTKFQLTPPTDIVVSVAPSIGGTMVFVPFGNPPVSEVIITKVPVLLGIPLGREQVVLGFGLQDFLVFGNGSLQANSIVVGTSAGIAFHLTDRFQLMPEVSVLFPIQGWSKRTNLTTTETADGVIYTVGLGCLWGNGR